MLGCYSLPAAASRVGLVFLAARGVLAQRMPVKSVVGKGSLLARIGCTLSCDAYCTVKGSSQSSTAVGRNRHHRLLPVKDLTNTSKLNCKCSTSSGTDRVAFASRPRPNAERRNSDTYSNANFPVFELLDMGFASADVALHLKDHTGRGPTSQGTQYTRILLRKTTLSR
ncbi:hypothetical protein GGI43DRAFT_317078 [Trichoderma evansii]